MPHVVQRAHRAKKSSTARPVRTRRKAPSPPRRSPRAPRLEALDRSARGGTIYKALRALAARLESATGSGPAALAALVLSALVALLARIGGPLSRSDRAAARAFARAIQEPPSTPAGEANGPRNGNGTPPTVPSPTTPPPPPGQPPPTLRALYDAAVLSTLGAPKESVFMDAPAAATPGELLLWTLGGSAPEPSLICALLDVSTALRSEALRGDPGSVEADQALEALAVRVRIIATLHEKALSSPIPSGAAPGGRS